MWPQTPEELVVVQRALAAARPEPWRPGERPLLVAGSFVCSARGAAVPGRAGEPLWAAAALVRAGRREVATAVVRGVAGAPYEPGLLALREGAVLEAAARALTVVPDVLLVDASGRDHPRGAGLALHLGAVLGVPSVGVTDRPLVASGPPSAEGRGAASPLLLDGVEVARRLRTRDGVRPLVVHAGWRTDLETAVAVVLGVTPRTRTPEPLRRARRAARTARAADERP